MNTARTFARTSDAQVSMGFLSHSVSHSESFGSSVALKARQTLQVAVPIFTALPLRDDLETRFALALDRLNVYVNLLADIESTLNFALTADQLRAAIQVQLKKLVPALEEVKDVYQPTSGDVTFSQNDCSAKSAQEFWQIGRELEGDIRS